MKTNGIGNGAVYTAAGQTRTREEKTREGFAKSESEEKKAYVRRPPAATLGQVPVQEVFERMAGSGSSVYRALGELNNEGLSDHTEQRERAMEKVWQEYDRLLPEEEKAGSVEKTETKSEIIVKPDGSRVLVVTTITNGVVTSVQSMEISKPTDAPNESGEEGEAEGKQEGEETEETETSVQELGAVSQQLTGTASSGN
ncbi:MAG: hypothetical protein HFI42_05220 [Lachnospiraceae bacterium]|nr:hypothetical protein [Lachnospiraceae bacterium]